MQCFLKKEDKSPIDVENVETTYFELHVLSSQHGPPFATVLFHPSQSCFSRIMCHLYFFSSPSSLVCSVF